MYEAAGAAGLGTLFPSCLQKIQDELLFLIVGTFSEPSVPPSSRTYQSLGGRLEPVLEMKIGSLPKTWLTAAKVFMSPAQGEMENWKSAGEADHQEASHLSHQSQSSGPNTLSIIGFLESSAHE